jgi:hypothetical protein
VGAVEDVVGQLLLDPIRVGAKNFGDAGGRIVAVQPLTQMVFEIVACVTFQ